MIDWQRLQEMLLAESEPMIRSLLAENAQRGDVIAAIGYVYEFGRGQLYFDMCANTARTAKDALAKFIKAWPQESAEEFRWNSGNYDYPRAVGRFGDEFWQELSPLDELAKHESRSQEIHDRTADMCCAVLAELARRGVLGDWSQIDFNVAALLDYEDVVKARDERIRQMIAAAP
jgi:hypothetical protein